MKICSNPPSRYQFQNVFEINVSCMYNLRILMKYSVDRDMAVTMKLSYERGEVKCVIFPMSKDGNFICN